MCGRFLLTAAPEAVRDLFGYENEEDFPPRYNIAPAQPILVVVMEKGRRIARLARWGLMPSWVKDPSTIRLLFNARSESAASRPAFRGAMRHRRCLVPASGFYEWRAGASGRKEPFLIQAADKRLLALAGIWETWSDPQGGEIDTASILTRPSEGALATIHDRMPLILDQADFAPWLDMTIPPQKALDAVTPVAGGRLDVVRVGDRVNSARFDDPGLIEPAERANPPTSSTSSDRPAAPRGQGRLFP